ncbi:MAG: hypothetical protein JWO84_724 [Parcubacteria group bacterium]|nr:hypothetical protein [Parcubacteria group bacterium]
MTHLSFSTHVALYAFSRRMSHIARRSSFYATALLLAFLPLRMFGFHPGWLPAGARAYAVVYGAGAVLGAFAAFGWREAEIFPGMGYWEYMYRMVGLLDEPARKKQVSEFWRQVFFWNLVFWPLRGGFKLCEVYELISRKDIAFTPTVWPHPRKTVWVWMWDRVRARFA